MTEDIIIIEGKKFIWDGINYESESAAKQNSEKYNNDGFETRLIEQEGIFYVYSRRVAGEIKTEGKP